MSNITRIKRKYNKMKKILISIKMNDNYELKLLITGIKRKKKYIVKKNTKSKFNKQNA